MIRLAAAILLCAAILAPAAARAQGVAPDVLVRTVTDDVIAVIKKDKDIQAGDQSKTIELVDEKVLPHFDFQRMTALAMGLNWRKASSEQRKELVGEFRTLLVRTYSTALTGYRDQVIEVLPLRTPATGDDVTVRSEVRQSGTEPVSIDYSMHRTPEGWKIYDVAVGGVSLVTTYRDTFNQEVRAHGVDGLIKSLAEKNRQLRAKR